MGNIAVESRNRTLVGVNLDTQSIPPKDLGVRKRGRLTKTFQIPISLSAIFRQFGTGRLFVFEIRVEDRNEMPQPMTHLRGPLGGPLRRLRPAESGS